MPKETAAQRRTRIGLLLADYDARSRELNKLMTIVKGLKEQIRELDAGTYNDWSLAWGTSREILDQPAARKALADAGIPIPMTATQPAIVVSPKVGK